VSLPEDYLRYPHRRQGQDQDRYAWSADTRPPRKPWPNGANVACMIVVPLEFHRLDPVGKPFKHPGAMQTPYPDLRHYTTRDYGNRVGVFRILRALAAARLKATFPVNAVLLERAPPLIDAIAAGGHEIAAYGWEADAIHWGGIEPAAEGKLVADTRAAFDKAGLKPRTWMSPARSQSFRTPDLVRAAGFDVCLDWEFDDGPMPMRTDAGDLLALPLLNELDDRTLLIDRRQTETEWRDQIRAAADLMIGEARSGQVLGFTMTPYVAGQPFRMWAVRDVLQSIASDARLYTATASSLADASAP
jgi:peptidoglycan/xylan/chitin deacetylase (PgdA/CDA1 family)